MIVRIVDYVVITLGFFAALVALYGLLLQAMEYVAWL